MRLRSCWLTHCCILMIGAVAVASAQALPQQSKQAPDPHNLVLLGDRFRPLKYDQMTIEQKTMIDHLLAGERGGANGPHNVLLRSPEVGDLAQRFGAATRFRTGIPMDVSQVVIIMTGRFWTAQYEWYGHRTQALQAGVAPAIVDAIAAGKRPVGMPADMEVAYNLIDELLTTHQVSDATFEAAKDRYGERGAFDLIGLSGWYGLVSMCLNVDRYPLPAGVQPGLQPLENPLPVAGKGFATPVPGVRSPAELKSSAKGKEFTLRGDRFKPLSYQQMTAEQQKMTDNALTQRGAIGSFNFLLRDPDAGQLFYDMGDRVRSHMSIPDKLKELTIILAARYWSSQFEWMSHRQQAVQAGLSADKVQAIAEGKRPVGMSADEEAVYNFITELFKTKQASDATFAAVKNVAGERGVVELMVVAGYYQAVAMFQNTDRLPLNTNQQPELKYLAKPLP